MLQKLIYSIFIFCLQIFQIFMFLFLKLFLDELAIYGTTVFIDMVQHVL